LWTIHSWRRARGWSRNVAGVDIGALPPIEYPGHFILKRITNAGAFRFKKRLLLIANALKQRTIGLEEVTDGIWSIHFCQVLLGRVDERDYVIRA
jgi:hypothetical protein